MQTNLDAANPGQQRSDPSVAGGEYELLEEERVLSWNDFRWVETLGEPC